MINRINRSARRRTVLASLLAVVSLPLLAGSAFAQTAKVDTSRLVSIGGSLTEIVYALGKEKSLVARDTTSVFPPDALTLPDVGYMRALSPEGVMAVNPSAILAIEGSGPRETLDVLQSAAIPFVMVPDHFTRDGILEKIRAVGAALDAEPAAEALAQSVAKDLDAAIATTASVPEAERKRVLFILSLQGGKVMAAGSGTAADGIIALAGGVNAVAAMPGYKPLTDEAIAGANPDVLLLMNGGGGHVTSDADLLAQPALAMTPAGQAKKFVRVDAVKALGFGPRTAEAVRDLATALYGSP